MSDPQYSVKELSHFKIACYGLLLFIGGMTFGMFAYFYINVWFHSYPAFPAVPAGNDVAAFYESAWSKLLLIGAIFGVGVPFLTAIYQQFLIRQDAKDIEERIKKATSEVEANIAKAIQEIKKSTQDDIVEATKQLDAATKSLKNELLELQHKLSNQRQQDVENAQANLDLIIEIVALGLGVPLNSSHFALNNSFNDPFKSYANLAATMASTKDAPELSTAISDIITRIDSSIDFTISKDKLNPQTNALNITDHYHTQLLYFILLNGSDLVKLLSRKYPYKPYAHNLLNILMKYTNYHPDLNIQRFFINKLAAIGPQKVNPNPPPNSQP